MAHQKRIVLTTFGSLGDLHPYVAIALELSRRGHQPCLATSEHYREKVTALGIRFSPVRPDIPDGEVDPELLRRAMDLRSGSEFVVRELVMTGLRDSYQDTLAACEGADLVVSHPLTFTARLVAETRGLAWASSMLSPIGFFSACDPPVLAPAQFLARLRFLGPGFHRPLNRLLKWWVRDWSAPVHGLRREIGLAPAPDPLFDGAHSPDLVLALFSSTFAPPQADWPASTRVTGFPFYGGGRDSVLAPELERFLDEGPAPAVFTLGSSAVMDAGSFFESSIAAARSLGCRAVLLTGSSPGNRPPTLPPGMAAFDYAAFSALFPRAAVIVHQGGVGTTAEAMRSGRAMLVMPYAHDQPDNAARVCRLGIARTISRRRYSPSTAAREIERLLGDPGFADRAAEVGKKVRAEDGVGAACDALEALTDRA